MIHVDMAWAAGFFDGEGGTYCSPSNGSLEIHVAQATPLLLQRFKAAVGVGKVLGPHKNNRPNQRDGYYYRVRGLSNVQYVLGQMWPWLGPEKKSQAVEAVRVWVQRPRVQWRQTMIEPF